MPIAFQRQLYCRVAISVSWTRLTFSAETDCTSISSNPILPSQTFAPNWKIYTLSMPYRHPMAVHLSVLKYELLIRWLSSAKYSGIAVLICSQLEAWSSSFTSCTSSMTVNTKEGKTIGGMMRNTKRVGFKERQGQWDYRPHPQITPHADRLGINKKCTREFSEKTIHDAFFRSWSYAVQGAEWTCSQVCSCSLLNLQNAWT